MRGGHVRDEILAAIFARHLTIRTHVSLRLCAKCWADLIAYWNATEYEVVFLGYLPPLTVSKNRIHQHRADKNKLLCQRVIALAKRRNIMTNHCWPPARIRFLASAYVSNNSPSYFRICTKHSFVAILFCFVQISPPTRPQQVSFFSSFSIAIW